MRIKTQHNRFKDIPWFPKEDIYVLIGGAGGIGSWVTLLLARAGFKILVHDMDTIEEHNLGGQFFSSRQIGEQKVDALAMGVKEYADEIILTSDTPITEASTTHLFAIAAFDNMKARKDMFTKWYELMKISPQETRDRAIFIDGRLTAEQLQIICVTAKSPDLAQRYMREYLFDDSEVEDAPCTVKQTTIGAMMIASHIAGFFTNHYTNAVEEDTTRTVPFFWEYFIPMDLLERI